MTVVYEGDGCAPALQPRLCTDQPGETGCLGLKVAIVRLENRHPRLKRDSTVSRTGTQHANMYVFTGIRNLNISTISFRYSVSTS